MTTSLDHAREPVTLTITLPAGQLPASGETIEVTVDEPHNVYIATIENRAELPTPRYIQPVSSVPRSLRYVPVEIAARASEVVHAAIIRRVNGRNHTERYTLCDRNGKRIVQRPIYSDLNDTVTCKQCRAQLEEDGVI